MGTQSSRVASQVCFPILPAYPAEASCCKPHKNALGFQDKTPAKALSITAEISWVSNYTPEGSPTHKRVGSRDFQNARPHTPRGHIFSTYKKRGQGPPSWQGGRAGRSSAFSQQCAFGLRLSQLLGRLPHAREEKPTSLSSWGITKSPVINRECKEAQSIHTTAHQATKLKTHAAETQMPLERQNHFKTPGYSYTPVSYHFSLLISLFKYRVRDSFLQNSSLPPHTLALHTCGLISYPACILIPPSFPTWLKTSRKKKKTWLIGKGSRSQDVIRELPGKE